MSVRIGEVSTTIDAVGNESGDLRETSAAGAVDGAGGGAFEVQLEELRPLVRALVAEEIERWWRQRSDCP